MADDEVTAVNDDFEEFLKRFKKGYSNPEKIMTPESLEEFREDVKKYFEMTSNKNSH